MGSHIIKQASLQKRTEKRVILGSDYHGSMDLDLMENFLFIAGKGVRCVLTEISIFSAKVLINGTIENYDAGVSVMRLMKAKELEGVGEILGNIERVDLINESESLFSIIITLNQDMIPPLYKLWIAECNEMIKI